MAARSDLLAADARRRIVAVSEALLRDAYARADALWRPHDHALRELTSRLERAALRGDPAAAAFLEIVDESRTRAIAYARRYAPDLLDLAEQIGRRGDRDGIALGGAPGPSPAPLLPMPLEARVGSTLASIATATTQSVTAAAAFGTTEGPRQVAQRLTAAFDTAPKRARLIARTEMMHAYRSAALDRYRANPAVVAWYWLAACDSRTCPVCWAMSGSIHPLDEPFGSHPACRCTPVPLTADQVVPGSADGPGRFAELAPGAQLAILGPSRAALYNAGMGLPTMVATRTNPVWGVSRQLVPVSALTQRAA